MEIGKFSDAAGEFLNFNYEINLRDPAFGISSFGSPYLSVNLCSVLGSHDPAPSRFLGLNIKFFALTAAKFEPKFCEI